MNVLYLSDFYLSDSRLLENLGRCIRASGEIFIIIPDGRHFLAKQKSIEPAMLFQPVPDLADSIQKDLITILTGSILKPMVSLLAEGMAPAVSFSGHQRKIVTLNNETISVNTESLKTLSGGLSNLILLATAEENGNARMISPITLTKQFQKAGATVFFIDETLPPDGVSSFDELKIWVDSEKLAAGTYSWINEWEGSFPVRFTNCAGLREFGQKKDRLLTIGN